MPRMPRSPHGFVLPGVPGGRILGHGRCHPRALRECQGNRWPSDIRIRMPARRIRVRLQHNRGLRPRQDPTGQRQRPVRHLFLHRLHRAPRRIQGSRTGLFQGCPVLRQAGGLEGRGSSTNRDLLRHRFRGGQPTRSRNGRENRSARSAPYLRAVDCRRRGAQRRHSGQGEHRSVGIRLFRIQGTQQESGLSSSFRNKNKHKTAVAPAFRQWCGGLSQRVLLRG
mmetsp:Transcript_26993/g.59349  ORF Transcript_26993/g.59349 Transcript_26993/m.59349 type:complete len:224 (+) Transcript_26993:311-982(+)